MYQSYNLSHKDAQKMISAVQEKLEKENKAGVIAVTDSHGELIAFLRMDGCRLVALNIAINKAFTAAHEANSTAEIGEAAKKFGYPMTNYGDLRYTGWAGGFPVMHEGKIVGAVGVAGLTENEEASFGQMAANLIK